MTKALTFAAIMLASAASAQDNPCKSEVEAGGDTIVLQQGVPYYEVVYTNVLDLESVPAFYKLCLDAVYVRVRIAIGQKNDGWINGEELIWVTPEPETGLIAEPPFAAVIDGESVTIRLIPPMF